MRLEKEYRYIYGVWQYVEMILNELGASNLEVKESGSEKDKLHKVYEAKLPDANIKAEVIYEKKHYPPFPKYFKKLAITTVAVDITSKNSEKEREYFDYFSNRLKLYTLRAAG
ncbi:MAG: hypothetical protein ACUVXA_08355 [Candidatus Jordarchaeum sp.]|uniref:hypothetical protein n=1 Tax=Candidatus Jordarchaeum sp. TaxID=2823881 RepID=UPI00404B68E3